MESYLTETLSGPTSLPALERKKKTKKLRTSDACSFGVGEGGYSVTYIQPIWKAIRCHFSKPIEMLTSSNSRLLLTGNIQQKEKNIDESKKRFVAVLSTIADN